MHEGLIERGLCRVARRRNVGAAFLRLLLSYIILVVAVVFFTALAAYFFFQGKYNSELKSLHDYTLRNTGHELESKLIEPSADIYMECATQILRSVSDFFGESEEPAGRAYKIYTTYQYLSALASRYRDRISGIHLYYRASDVVISSNSGLHMGMDSDASQEGRAWLDAIAKEGGRRAWILGEGGSISAASSGPYLRIVRCYPILSGASDCTVVIAIDFRLSQLRATIAGPRSASTGVTLLVDQSGRVLESSRDLGKDEGLLEAAAEAIERASAESDSYFRTIHGAQSLVSSIRLSSQDFVLVNITPSAALYGPGDSIRFRVERVIR